MFDPVHIYALEFMGKLRIAYQARQTQRGQPGDNECRAIAATVT